MQITTFLVKAALLMAFLLVPLSRGLAAEDTETETRVSMEQLPAAVRAVYEQFAAAGEVDDIYREEEGGVVAYSAEVEIGESEFELKLSPEGHILEVEAAEGDEGDDDARDGADEDEDCADDSAGKTDDDDDDDHDDDDDDDDDGKDSKDDKEGAKGAVRIQAA